MSGKLQELLRLVGEIRSAQAEDCRHEDHCHRFFDLLEAETIVRDLIREETIAESIRVCSRHIGNRQSAIENVK